MSLPTYAIYHDIRRKKENGLYPVKLRVYFEGKKMRYPLALDLSKEDFEKSYLTQAPRLERYRQIKSVITSFYSKASQIIEDLQPFDFDKFEKHMFRPTSSIGNVFYFYDQTIKKLNDEDRIGTASNYELSKKSIESYLKDLGQKGDRLPFDAINEKLLNGYERWMLKEGKGLTTVGIYLRPLRALFNAAIEAEEIKKDLYPFRKGKYQIPAGSSIKKALDKSDLKKLFEFYTDDELIIKARSFWFFSYLCNGINIRDICELKYKNIDGEKVTFIRAKTRQTTKANQTTIVAAMLPLIAEVIERYGNQKRTNETYVFPIFNDKMTAEEKLRATQAFTRFINQHMKRLAKKADVSQDISTYYARHTFSTLSMKNGVPLAFIQKALGHQNIKTTMAYLGSFDHEEIKKNADKLMSFD